MKKIPKGKRIYVPVDLYKIGVTFLLGGTQEWLKREIKKTTGEFPPDSDFDYVAGRIYLSRGNSPLIFVRDAGSVIGWITLAHETLHAAIHILNDRGIILDPKNDEPLAYLQGYILLELNKRLEKQKK